MRAKYEPFAQADLAEMVLRLSHTIRNPLASIKGVIQLVHHLSSDNQEIADYLGSALLDVERIDSIVRDMQHLVRLDSHTAVTVKVAEAVQEAFCVVAEQARRREVSLEVGEHDDSVVLVDPDQLLRVLTELLDNAVHFTAVDSRVVVSWLATEGGWVLVHVDDQGPGVPAHESERLLRPFYSTRTRGSGLGLNIVDRFCALQGGRLEWTTRKEGGSRFSISVCRVPA